MALEGFTYTRKIGPTRAVSKRPLGTTMNHTVRAARESVRVVKVRIEFTVRGERNPGLTTHERSPVLDSPQPRAEKTAKQGAVATT